MAQGCDSSSWRIDKDSDGQTLTSENTLLSPLQVATNKDLHENLQMLTMHEWNVQYVMKFKK